MERKENRLILFLDAISNSFQISCHFLLTCLLAARESSEACYLKYREGSVIDIESWWKMVILIKFKCKTARNDLHITLENITRNKVNFDAIFGVFVFLRVGNFSSLVLLVHIIRNIRYLKNGWIKSSI